jgi:hypothetical protein
VVSLSCSTSANVSKFLTAASEMDFRGCGVCGRFSKRAKEGD